MAITTPAVAALKEDAPAIPVVFVAVSDPVGNEFVDSLPLPGGNITGFINLEGFLSGKWLELLKEVVPGLTHVDSSSIRSERPFAEYVCARSRLRRLPRGVTADGDAGPRSPTTSSA